MQHICSAEKNQAFCGIFLCTVARVANPRKLFLTVLCALAAQFFVTGAFADTSGTLEPITIPTQTLTSPTILQTDIVPLAGPSERSALSDDLQIRLLNKLPSRFYFNASCESTFRLETNPFQMPPASSLVYKFTNGRPLYMLSAAQRYSLNRQLGQVNDTQQISRVLPNITAGWCLTESTRLYCNSFLIRDTALKTSILDTTVGSIGMGIQQDIPVPRPFNLQADFQGRELYQTGQIPVFDYIPSLTLSYARSARTVAFVSALLQLRGRQPFVAPNREIDPFYSFGIVHRRGQYTFSAYSTFVQNFRQPFGGNALIPVNNDSLISDFEIARTISKRIPMQVLIRAEPVFNFHSNATASLSGFDFRLFYGLRMQMSKPSLLVAKHSIEQQLKQIDKFKTNDNPGNTPGDSSMQPKQGQGQEQRSSYQIIDKAESIQEEVNPESPREQERQREQGWQEISWANYR